MLSFIAITCPNIYPTPFQTVTCPSGTRYGSICNFSCEAGTKLNGTDIVVCERKNDNKFGEWTWGNNQPSCEGILLEFIIFFWKIHDKLEEWECLI